MKANRHQVHQWLADARYRGSGEHPKYPQYHLDRIHMDQGFIFATDSITMRAFRDAPEGVTVSLTYEQFLTWSLLGTLPDKPQNLVLPDWKDRLLDSFLARPRFGVKVSIENSGAIQVKATEV